MLLKPRVIFQCRHYVDNQHIITVLQILQLHFPLLKVNNTLVFVETVCMLMF